MGRDEKDRSLPDDLQETVSEEKTAANKIFTVPEDNETRPYDKIEGRMNNGETGGAGNTEEHGKNRG